MDLDVRTYKTEQKLYDTAALALLKKLDTLARAQQTDLHVGVAGGSIATRLLPALVGLIEQKSELTNHWCPIHLWLVDERFVDLDGEDRTDSIIERAFSSKVPAVTLHRPLRPSEGTLEEAAADYEQQLIDQFGGNSAAVKMDLLIMGMGPDGHIASLFPSHETLDAAGLVTFEDDSPKPPPQRITMTMNLLKRSRFAWFVIAGKDKAAVLSSVASGGDYREIPAIALNQVGTLWWCDKAAASKLTAEL
ncbi:6-phosphogluconolactonase [Gleimia hominis]|uniref:6-phosphogluconolactonase n=1 Tax=Gleimia hominis TaxID=595468 RepID=A0ABU3IB63_9ACTO|nr:6-phosphogluconolactonase [Gleimia hominis]MDT3767620.1 6-phosphogluconolactonase [Gleimia hominis]